MIFDMGIDEMGITCIWQFGVAWVRSPTGTGKQYRNRICC